MLRVIPAPIRDPGYDLVARYRYHLFGRRAKCQLATPEEAARFVAAADVEKGE